MRRRAVGDRRKKKKKIIYSEPAGWYSARPLTQPAYAISFQGNTLITLLSLLGDSDSDLLLPYSYPTARNKMLIKYNNISLDICPGYWNSLTVPFWPEITQPMVLQKFWNGGSQFFLIIYELKRNELSEWCKSSTVVVTRSVSCWSSPVRGRVLTRYFYQYCLPCSALVALLLGLSVVGPKKQAE